MLIYASQPQSMPRGNAPPWVTEWLEGRRLRVQKREERQAAADDVSPEAVARREASQTRRAESREQKVAAGVDDLRLWLSDIMRRGLGATSQEPMSFWETAAARLVDAQAPGAARLVREAGQAVHGGPLWQDRLLARLAQLHLLTEAHRHIDSLSPALQAEVRSLLGWTQATEELQARPGVKDQWAVLARTVDADERLRVQRTWLWGVGGQRPALVLSFAHKTGALDISLAAGTCIEAELVYYDAAWPLRAAVKDHPQVVRGLEEMPGFRDTEAASAAYAAALALSPFVEQFPMPLVSAVFGPLGDGWVVQDAEGRSLPAVASNSWRLTSFVGGQPAGLFGLWDGRQLQVLSATAAGRHLQL
jgi:hypothetical protein